MSRLYDDQEKQTKNIVVLILLSEIKKLKTVSLPVHITQKKKKNLCLPST